MSLGKFLLGSILVIAPAGCNRNPASSAAQETVVPKGEIGSRLPEFDVKDLHGNEVSSKELRGKVVLIDIWATWCQPCRKEMPGYQKLLDRYGSRGFAVVGLKSNIMMDTEQPTKFAKEIGVRYPLISASSELVAEFGELRGLPTTLIYDRQGVLRKKVIGFDYVENFERTVSELL